jgi:hypothetical protein
VSVVASEGKMYCFLQFFFTGLAAVFICMTIRYYLVEFELGF